MMEMGGLIEILVMVTINLINPVECTRESSGGVMGVIHRGQARLTDKAVIRQQLQTEVITTHHITNVARVPGQAHLTDKAVITINLINPVEYTRESAGGVMGIIHRGQAHLTDKAVIRQQLQTDVITTHHITNVARVPGQAHLTDKAVIATMDHRITNVDRVPATTSRDIIVPC